MPGSVRDTQAADLKSRHRITLDGPVLQEQAIVSGIAQPYQSAVYFLREPSRTHRIEQPLKRARMFGGSTAASPWRRLVTTAHQPPATRVKRHQEAAD
jgi:hypothetical protein